MGNPTDAGSGQSGLDSLSINGFRGIDQLHIPRLGRVALLTGKNGIGKTTVLEALSVYATRGRLRALRETLARRDEWTSLSDGSQGAREIPALDRLFYEDEDTKASTIAIGPNRDGPVFELKRVDVSALPNEVAVDIFDGSYGEDPRVLRVAFGAKERFYAVPDIGQVRQLKWKSEPFDAPIHLGWLGPQMTSNRHLARLWDEMVRENLESLALSALRLVYGNDVERAPVMIGDGSDRRVGRRAVVKLRNRAFPVPLRSLGDGTARILSAVLSLANCRDGILLIDEAENGIHYSLHSEFWNMVLRTAEAHNTQVIATTHSKDCINGFAAAALACPDVGANLVRIGQRNGKLRAVDYSAEELETAAEQDIEVR